MMLTQHGETGGLLVDLYHIDAAYVAWRAGITAEATFDLYTRHAPFGGSYLLVAGLGPALDFVRGFRFHPDDIAFLRTCRTYGEDFLAALQSVRFTGSIQALPEGELAFPHEPMARVTAPFIEALLLESGLLHTIGVSTLIATKAARIVQAADGRPVAEFGYRRAQEPFLAARSAYVGGCASTSFVAAARVFGIPVSGTIPHALVESFPDEAGAFRAVAETLDTYSLLLDTYDVETATRTAAEIAREVQGRLGHRLTAVRLDSGNLAQSSRAVRRTLGEYGLHEVRIVVSGDLDEWTIRDLVASGAPIDGFGVGTSIAVGAGSGERGIEGGALGAVYKLVWYEGTDSPARIKIAGEKSTWPGKKRLVRIGEFEHDIIQLDSEPIPSEGRSLLQPVVEAGETIVTPPSLHETRQNAMIALGTLPARYQDLEDPAEYPVRWSQPLREMRDLTLAAHGHAPAH